MPLLAGFPPVLWALSFFFLGLGLTARVDIPLAVFAMTAALSLGDIERGGWRNYLQQHWPLVLFLVVAAVTTVTSVDPLHSVQVQPQLLPALLCYAVIISFVTTLPRLRFACTGLLAGGMLTAVLMLSGASQMDVDDPLVKVKLLGNGLLIVPNDVLLLSVIAPLALGLAWSARWWLRLVVATYLLLALVACVVMHSRQAVVVWALGLVLVATWMRPRWIVPFLLVTTAGGLLVDGLLGWPLLNKIFMFPRIYVWHTAWAMFVDRPWLGQGPGMFKDLYFPFLEKAGYVLADLGDRRTMPWAHNLYLEQLAERGLPGLVALLCLLGRALLHGVRKVRHSALPEARGLQVGITSALLALVISGVAEASLSRLWVTVLLLVLVAFCSLEQLPQE
ncbi:MAG TPA: O-antigen ligase family protein [Pseudomonadales bacterium]|nr:O-antigen ligase family protein [Pseudomonadales bacterium]